MRLITNYTTYANAVHAACGTPEECARLRAENASLTAQLAALEDMVHTLRADLHKCSFDKLLAEGELASCRRALAQAAAGQPRLDADAADELTNTGDSYRVVDAALRRLPTYYVGSFPEGTS
jgi:hypothetical protein